MNRYIWKFICVVGLLSLTYGCAYFSERAAAMQQCGGDPKCLEAVVNSGKAGKAVGDATGIPWAGAAAGGLVAFMTLFFARKKKDE